MFTLTLFTWNSKPWMIDNTTQSPWKIFLRLCDMGFKKLKNNLTKLQLKVILLNFTLIWFNLLHYFRSLIFAMWPLNLWFITNLQTPIVLFRFISKAFWLMEFLYTVELLLNSIWHCARILILRRGPVSNSRLTFNSLHLKFLIKSRNQSKIGVKLTNLQCQYIVVHFPQHFSGVAVL